PLFEPRAIPDLEILPSATDQRDVALHPHGLARVRWQENASDAVEIDFLRARDVETPDLADLGIERGLLVDQRFELLPLLEGMHLERVLVRDHEQAVRIVLRQPSPGF